VHKKKKKKKARVRKKKGRGATICKLAEEEFGSLLERVLDVGSNTKYKTKLEVLIDPGANRAGGSHERRGRVVRERNSGFLLGEKWERGGRTEESSENHPVGWVTDPEKAGQSNDFMEGEGGLESFKKLQDWLIPKTRAVKEDSIFQGHQEFKKKNVVAPAREGGVVRRKMENIGESSSGLTLGSVEGVPTHCHGKKKKRRGKTTAASATRKR